MTDSGLNRKSTKTSSSSGITTASTQKVSVRRLDKCRKMGGGFSCFSCFPCLPCLSCQGKTTNSHQECLKITDKFDIKLLEIINTLKVQVGGEDDGEFSQEILLAYQENTLKLGSDGNIKGFKSGRSRSKNKCGHEGKKINGKATIGSEKGQAKRIPLATTITSSKDHTTAPIIIKDCLTKATLGSIKRELVEPWMETPTLKTFNVIFKLYSSEDKLIYVIRPNYRYNLLTGMQKLPVINFKKLYVQEVLMKDGHHNGGDESSSYSTYDATTINIDSDWKKPSTIIFPKSANFINKIQILMVYAIVEAAIRRGK